MSAIVNDVYKKTGVGYLCGKGTLPSLTIRLYSNNVAFGDGTTSGLTECSGSGYSAQAAGSSVWTLSSTSGTGTSTSSTFTFTFTGAITIWGWYATDGNNSNAYVMGEQFSSSFVFTSVGGTLLLQVVVNGTD
jgi:hypothetical protein